MSESASTEDEARPEPGRNTIKRMRSDKSGKIVSDERRRGGRARAANAGASIAETEHGTAGGERPSGAIETFRVGVYRRLRAAQVAVAPGWGRMLAQAFHRRSDLSQDDMVNVIRRRASELGLGIGVVARAAGAYPALLQQETAILRRRLEHLTELLGGDAKDALRVAGLEPRLLLQRRERTAANFSRLVAGLGLPPSVLRSLVRRWPGVLAQSPETVIERQHRLALVLGVQDVVLRKVVVAQPKLLAVSGTRLAANAAALAKGLGADEQQMNRIISWMPQTLYQRPETVLCRIDETARLMNVDGKSMRHLALRQPALLLRRPESVAERAVWILRLGRVCGENVELDVLMGRVPMALNFSLRALRMRYILACLRAGRISYRGVLLLASERAEKALASELCARLGRQEAMGRLQRLSARGLLEAEACDLLEAAGI